MDRDGIVLGILREFRDDQPRDDRGRWSPGGGETGQGLASLAKPGQKYIRTPGGTIKHKDEKGRIWTMDPYGILRLDQPGTSAAGAARSRRATGGLEGLRTSMKARALRSRTARILGKNPDKVTPEDLRLQGLEDKGAKRLPKRAIFGDVLKVRLADGSTVDGVISGRRGNETILRTASGGDVRVRHSKVLSAAIVKRAVGSRE